MNNAPDLNKDFDFQKLLTQWGMKSQAILKGQTKNSEIQIEEYSPKFSVQGYWLSLANLSCTDFGISFKIFYNTEQALPFCQPLFKKSIEQIGKDQLRDFTKEFCNLVIGRIKYDLEKNQIICSTALPISLRAFDNIFFIENEHNQFFKHYWRLHNENSEFVCCLTLEVYESTALQNINIEIDSAIDSGGFELI
jgi:hypothetical protein